MIYKDLITFLIALIGFFMSLYNFTSDKRKIKLTYLLTPHESTGKYIFAGILSNPSKTPNSLIGYSFHSGSTKIKTAKYKKDGFDVGAFFMPSALGPLKIATPIESGGTIFFKSVLLTDLNPNQKIRIKFKTANYTKSFKIKLKDDF